MFEQLNTIREKVTLAIAEREQAKENSLQPKEIEKRINDYIDYEAAEFRGFDSIIENAQVSSNKPHEAQPFMLNVTDRVFMGPMICALFGDELKLKFKKRLNALNLPAGVTPAQRKKQIIELDEEIYRLSIQEEELICQLEADGFEVVRRIDCDPKIVLGYEEIEAEEAELWNGLNLAKVAPLGDVVKVGV